MNICGLTSKTNGRASGQVLPLFALFLIALLAMAALAIDVSGVLAARRYYRSVADAASLAGGQDLQQGKTRIVTPGDRTRARTHALEQASSLLGVPTPASCNPSADILDCVVGSYLVSVKTPSPTCVDCDPDRSVQVTVRNPAYPLSFARLLGQNAWNVGSTSVAGLAFGKAYTIVTLRPPQPNGASGTYDVRDFRLDGGTVVEVINGDVGTNSNMEYGGIDSLLKLSTGYAMYYYDPYNSPEWTPPSPANPDGKKLPSMIPDPQYSIPGDGTINGPPGPTGAQDTDEAVGSTCQSAAVELLGDSSFSGYQPYVPLDSVTGLPDMSMIECYKPGVYAGNYAKNPNTSISVDNDHLAILEPGLYWLNGNLDVQGSVIGGFTPGSEGVALVFKEASAHFNLNTSGGGTDPQAVALNAGTRFNSAFSGTEASAALDFSGNSIVTNTNPAVKMTLMVTHDTNCRVQIPYPSACDPTNKNYSIDLTGNSTLYLAGVQYMPTDNATINSSGAFGYVGQIWAWTLKYAGGTTLTQEGSQGESIGVLRLDAACTAPSTPCNNP